MLGGGRDYFIRPPAIRRTADAYGAGAGAGAGAAGWRQAAEAMVLPGVAHDVMLDTGWRQATEAMLEWLERTHAPAFEARRAAGLNATSFSNGLLADECELCGSTEDVQVHHVRALRDLNVEGRGAKSPWAQVVAARRRKTLVVCRPCHLKAHGGNWNPQQQR